MERRYEELYQVAVQPIAEAEKLFPNRPASPGLKERRKAAAVAAETASAASPSPVAAASSYVPPHLRGRVGAEAVNVVSAMIKGDRGSEGHKKIATTQVKAAGGAGQGGGGEGGGGGGGGGKKGKKKGGAEDERKEGKEAVTPPSMQEEKASAGNAGKEVKAPAALEVESLPLDGCEKRLKAAAKKAKQIAELQSRQEAGEKLDEGQLQKLTAAAEVNDEIERLRQRIEHLKSG